MESSWLMSWSREDVNWLAPEDDAVVFAVALSLGIDAVFLVLSVEYERFFHA
jgi:hypothetical protein